MKTSEFDYHLPAELIAQHPLADRTASRMMVVDRASSEIRHDQFRNLGQYLSPGDLLVLNDTKVMPTRIWSHAPAVELLLVEKLGPNRWTALVRPGRKAHTGDLLKFDAAKLTARVGSFTDFGGRVIEFEGDIEGYIARHGAAPLPPYIKRPGRGAADRERYQTVFAREPGAVAAPTAGLHFTQELLDQLRAAGVAHTFITLHVGLGTFRPVKVLEIEDHKMHPERFSISGTAADAIRAAQRVVAVGTTVVRTLETSARHPSTPSLHHSITPCSGQTDIFIRSPFEFHVVDVILTNFHLPRSTLLMLVCAFAGRELVLRAYEEAVQERYRFFSYGDCMLIL